MFVIVLFRYEGEALLPIRAQLQSSPYFIGICAANKSSLGLSGPCDSSLQQYWVFKTIAVCGGVWHSWGGFPLGFSFRESNAVHITSASDGHAPVWEVYFLIGGSGLATLLE